MKGIGVKAVKRYVEWIVKKTPVQLNPPKRIAFYNLSHGRTTQGDTHGKTLGLARAQARIGLVDDGQGLGLGTKPSHGPLGRSALCLALAPVDGNKHPRLV
jgi:hypothetical protein